MSRYEILQGDCREALDSIDTESIHCCVTSPPYWGLRDYGVAGQLGLEKTPDEYVAEMVKVFRNVRRVLRSDGTLWLNLGDSYASGWACARRSEIGNGSAPLKSRVNRLSMQATNLSSEMNASPNRQPLAGLKEKDLVGIPWMVAFALRLDGWYLRQDIIWSKPNPMPESVTDRCTKAHEYIFLLSKSARYFYDSAAIAEPIAPSSIDRLNQDVESQDGSPVPFKTNGNMKARVRNDKFGGNKYEGEKHSEQSTFTGSETRNKRSVWNVSTKPYSEAHFATFPPDLIEPCIKAGCPVDGTVLDPFSGAGTTGLMASRLGRNYLGIELNPEYVEMSKRRIEGDCPMFNEVTATFAASEPLLPSGESVSGARDESQSNEENLDTSERA